jgi:hypothetical protein
VRRVFERLYQREFAQRTEMEVYAATVAAAAGGRGHGETAAAAAASAAAAAAAAAADADNGHGGLSERVATLSEAAASLGREEFAASAPAGVKVAVLQWLADELCEMGAVRDVLDGRARQYEELYAEVRTARREERERARAVGRGGGGGYGGGGGGDDDDDDDEDDDDERDEEEEGDDADLTPRQLAQRQAARAAEEAARNTTAGRAEAALRAARARLEKQLGAASDGLRFTPVGQDRNWSQYFVLPGDAGGAVYVVSSTVAAALGVGVGGGGSGAAAAVAGVGAAAGAVGAAGTELGGLADALRRGGAAARPLTIVSCAEDLDALLGWLEPKGNRERALLGKLRAQYKDLVRKMNKNSQNLAGSGGAAMAAAADSWALEDDVAGGGGGGDAKALSIALEPIPFGVTLGARGGEAESAWWRAVVPASGGGGGGGGAAAAAAAGFREALLRAEAMLLHAHVVGEDEERLLPGGWHEAWRAALSGDGGFAACRAALLSLEEAAHDLNVVVADDWRVNELLSKRSGGVEGKGRRRDVWRASCAGAATWAQLACLLGRLGTEAVVWPVLENMIETAQVLT